MTDSLVFLLLVPPFGNGDNTTCLEEFLWGLDITYVNTHHSALHSNHLVNAGSSSYC